MNTRQLRALLPLGLLLAAASPAADPIPPDVQKIMSHMLPMCELVDRDQVQLCRQNQDQFAREYNNALAGDYLAQVNTAYGLHSGDDKSVTVDPSQACAWGEEIVKEASPYFEANDISTVRSDCASLAGRQVTMAADDLRVLRTRIASHRFRMIAVPEIGYDPRTAPNETDR